MGRYHDTRHRFDFTCDEPGCLDELVYEDSCCSQREADKMARADGWALAGKRVLCTKHRRAAQGGS